MSLDLVLLPQASSPPPQATYSPDPILTLTLNTTPTGQTVAKLAAYNAPAAPGSDTPPRNGLNVTDAVYNTRSSIRRVPEHRMVPAEVCDAQDPAVSTSCGRDIDTTLLPPRGQTRLRVTV